ncbi:AMIN-like domain-containing (lipo)protein [Streptomyces globosus]|uniref:AMIN-like domain-containing (lipo)protein n=1 Tax=Streptomyces sp. WAC05292 TaxID=2487418 RepID=UPI000F738FA6|nr:hypothetical protein [Streptomyces sp. WAC05292]RSS91538.1 hypothetical protein EF903_10925 [Streptomyces sp. WAC05292]
MKHLRRRRAAALATGVLLTAAIALAAPASTAAAPAGRAPATPLVVGARWAGHCTYDRIVVDLKGRVPDADVTRVPALFQDGSGAPVPLAGKHFLQIRLHPAAAHLRSGEGTYRGPRLVRTDLPALKGLAMTGDFEGYVTFGAAFDSRPSYRTFTLRSPDRFVIDIAHRNVCCD